MTRRAGFLSLVHIEDSLQIVPELAESVEPSDEVTYVVCLRKGVLFHNGRELTADDVVYAFKGFLDPTFRGRSGAYRVLGSVTALQGLRLSPIADFLFLKNVHRSGAGLTAGGAE